MSRPYQIFDSSNLIVFDGNLAVCFIVNMTSDVDSARVKNIAPGCLYTFIFHQNGQGNRFDWPGQCLNASPIDMTPGATTVQNFIGVTGGNLQANLPGTRREI